MRPARARKEKPKVSAFLTAKIDRILELEPDLALGFSDIQADIAAELIRHGVEVHIFNHRSVAGILRTVKAVAALAGCPDKGERLAAELEAGLDRIRERTATLPRRPSVYFEEWYDPLISGIRWVSELIELAGGDDCFPEHRDGSLAKDRIIADPSEVVRRAPDLIIGSWCGRKFRPERVAAREGWAAIPAVAGGHVHEVKSALILQPGPAALTDGVEAIQRIISEWAFNTQSQKHFPRGSRPASPRAAPRHLR